MNLNFLGAKIVQALNKLNLDKLYEIRLRVNYPVKINFDNVIYVLTDDGICKGVPIICDKTMIDGVVNCVTKNSLYAFNEQIKRGYLTVNGIRVGLAGECVIDNGTVITLKNFTSLNVRIPHEIKDCARKVMKYLTCKGKIKNTLIVSPPFCGKTTILKDVALKLNCTNRFNILIIDERGEFENITGENIDTITYSDKLYAFEYGIRSLSPNVVLTDELSGEKDWKCVKAASNSGINVIASCHADTLENVANKSCFIKDVFERYIILKNNGSLGVVDKVYDKNFNII